jgi:UDP-N-acetylmuramyl pentapeptide phosphotransferase/UDP-N-acetylglucosamine-1-phosphate transferase
VLLSVFCLLLALAVSAGLSTWLANAGRDAVSASGAGAPHPGALRPLSLHALDYPNARSLHQQPTPRTGGLALLAGMAAGVLPGLILGDWPLSAATARLLAALAVATLLVGAVSLLDDLRGLPRRYRLLAHLLAALLLITAGLRWDTLGLPGALVPLPAALVWPLSVLFILWLINLYNFMDGMDGLAASMALFGFGALGMLGLHQGEWLYAFLNGLVVAAALGFLSRNFPPARLFMGDVGSSVLGLLAAAFSLWGARAGLFPLWVAWLAFSPFIVDATWTLLRRALKGERVWEAHRSHHYQRLVLAGWSHRQTLIRASLLMAAAASCAVAAPALAPRDQWLLLLGWAAIYGLVHWRVSLTERATTNTTGNARGRA